MGTEIIVAIIGGVFLLIAAVIIGVFDLRKKEPAGKEPSVQVPKNTQPMFIHPTSPSHKYKVAMERHKQGEFTEAVRLMEEALAEQITLNGYNEDTYTYYNSLGNFYADDHLYAKAIDSYINALGTADSKFSAKIYYNRGKVYSNNGEYDKAISDYYRAIELNPNYAKAYNNRGRAYYDKGEYDRAISDYNRAIGLNPNYAKAYCGRGIMYKLQGDQKKAEQDFKKAEELDPKLFK